jgi:hypothetical protein
MRIYEADGGARYVNAISSVNGVSVDGHNYQLVDGTKHQELEFQFGPVAVSGVNGLQNEALISVLVHRLGVLNKAFPCRENSIALTHLETALLWLEKRTADRRKRGVEGKNEL